MTQLEARPLIPAVVPPELTGLHARLLGSWNARTGVSGDFDPERPSTGQCAVTAVLVHSLFGGEIVRVLNAGDSHYFNRLPDGTIADLTRDQFDVWEPTDEQTRERNVLLANADFAVRYAYLRYLVED